MFGLKSMFTSVFNQAWKSINNLNYVTVNYAHSRGIFAHEKGPRGKQYKPKVMKRIATYGLKTKLQTRGGQQILWRKIIKGQYTTLVVAP